MDTPDGYTTQHIPGVNQTPWPLEPVHECLKPGSAAAAFQPRTTMIASTSISAPLGSAFTA